MDPPAHDSPNNILNALIDDCIDHIFRSIFRLEDYLNMAQVCKRFQQSAKNCFRTQFPSVCLYRYPETKEKFADITIPSTRAIELLNTFGPSIQGVKLINTPNQKHDDEIFNSVVEFCNTTLKELYIYGDNRAERTIDFKQKFPALKILHLYYVSPMSFDQIHALEELEICLIDPSCFIREIPRLKCFRFSDNYYGPYFMTDDMFCKFVMLNPQLQCLNFWACRNLTPIILRAIGENSVSLVELVLPSLRYHTPNLLNMSLPFLGLLNQLQSIDLPLHSTDSFEVMINAFAENGVPIESIKLHLFIGGDHSIDACSNLKTIKTLKHFYMDSIRNLNVFSDNEMLFNLLRTQTALETIKILCSNENPISMKNIRNMLTYGIKLTKFELIIGILDLNLEIYESVLYLVRNRTRVKIVIGNEKSQCIPEGVPTNNEWLEVRYFRCNDKEGAGLNSLEPSTKHDHPECPHK